MAEARTVWLHVEPRHDGHRGPLVAYLGWHGRSNLGDDAIYDAVRSQLPERRLSICHAFHTR